MAETNCYDLTAALTPQGCGTHTSLDSISLPLGKGFPLCSMPRAAAGPSSGPVGPGETACYGREVEGRAGNAQAWQDMKADLGSN